MTRQDESSEPPPVGSSRYGEKNSFSEAELALAFRNRGMPMEGLRYPITPTGMHYLLDHFDIPYVDASTWQLKIDGLVSAPLNLTLDDIKQRPAATFPVTMECAGNGRALLDPRPISQPWLLEAISTAEWTGTPLRGILEEAGVKDEAVDLVFTGRDRGVQGDIDQLYQFSQTVQDASREEVMLVYEMNGQPLEPQHGYPLRLIVPGWYGMTSVKWLDRIEAIGEPFRGFQQRSYGIRQSADDPGEPVDLIQVRSLMIPPGIPDAWTRNRLLEAGSTTITGRAWAGRLGVSRVEVTVDGGTTWSDAAMEDPVGPLAWRGWSFEWDAKPGKHLVCVRATDTEGNVQSFDQPWNHEGLQNNMAHKVEVTVS